MEEVSIHSFAFGN